MAKRKRRKNESTSKVKFSVELTGLLFVLIGIIGIGSFGPVGHLIKSFAIFAMGTWWAILIVLFIVLGLYMILKGDLPKFYNSRLVGLYFLLISLLALSHINYFSDAEIIKNNAIFENTINIFMEVVKDDGFTNLSQTGGGIIGAFASWGLINLFELTGTYIVLGVFAFFGLIMSLNVSFAKLIKRVVGFFSKLGKGVKSSGIFEPEEEDERDDEDEETIPINNNHLKVISENDLDKYHEHNDESEKKNIEIIIPSSNGNYNLPPIDLLNNVKAKKINNMEWINNNKVALERVLKDFGIIGKVVDYHEGPAVTQFEVEVKAGTKVSHITGISKEIALALAAKDVRIEAPIPGKSTVGVEIPNLNVSSVPIKDILTTIPKSAGDFNILVSLGKDLMGKTKVADISKMPHLLVAGATGAGKSVCINSFIASILMRMTPDEIRLVLVDPKKVELVNYNDIPHLLWPVVTDPKKASVALQKIVLEMDRRYNVFSENGVKNIAGYNEKIEKNNKKNGTNDPKLPYIVVIIDELADLMLIARKEVEDSIMRITQLARAAGIHLIVATQRPSTDVITGVIKANIPSRISFAVSSQIDSRTILDKAGAEKLLGHGDMLYLPMGENTPVRIQGSFISDEETDKLIDFVKSQQTASYDTSLNDAVVDNHMAGAGSGTEEYEDPLYNEIVDFCIQSGKVSASLLQRKFRLGFSRAARIVDLLEERGIIGPQNGSKPREVLVKLDNNNEEE